MAQPFFSRLLDHQTKALSMQATAGVKYSLISNDVLFSDQADFAHCLDVIASLRSHAIAGYCLLPNELHLLSLGQEADLPAHLLHALTGDSAHPLAQAFKQQHLTPTTLTQALIRLHTLPVEREQAASADGYRWTSHYFYTGQQPAPGWLAMESFWQLQEVRRASWVRTYAAALNPDKLPLTMPQMSKPAPADLTSDLVIVRVLAHFSCNPEQLQHARMRRRRNTLAGIARAACQQLGLDDTQPLTALFAMTPAQLDSAARQASRQHAGLLHRLVASLMEKAKPTHAQPLDREAVTNDGPTSARLALVSNTEFIAPQRTTETAVSHPATGQ